TVPLPRIDRARERELVTRLRETAAAFGGAL
ncbi:hypothetical protein HNQ78_003091, partial [Phycisphaera mikurensis]|nr:hypothetical protein [Phycisphaera mikurensis]MBB6443320.1 hypothetical protein [Phycisphaera mikurensis]